MRRHRDQQSILERFIVAIMLAASAALFLFLVMAWWFDTAAHATRVVPGAQLADMCVNRAGTQTILDITTGHRYRVVAVTTQGNVCRPIHRRYWR